MERSYRYARANLGNVDVKVLKVNGYPCNLEERRRLRKAVPATVSDNI